MKISAQEEYGIRCLIQLARNRDAGPLSISQIARREGLSIPYVSKLLYQLRRARIVASVRGSRGGFTLPRSPEAISLTEVIQALSGPFVDEALCDKYPGNLDQCVHVKDCGIRPIWLTLGRLFYGTLSQTTLGHLLQEEDQVRVSVERAVREREDAVLVGRV